MKKFFITILALAANGCATLLQPPDWKFDCEWARFYDFQQNVRFKFDYAPFRSRWTEILCGGDPTSLEYWGSTPPRRVEKIAPAK